MSKFLTESILDLLLKTDLLLFICINLFFKLFAVLGQRSDIAGVFLKFWNLEL